MLILPTFILIIGCGEKINELDVARREIEEHSYDKASIRLEKFIKKATEEYRSL